MGKIICVWGNSGSGKTVFSCLLAKLLTRKKQQVLIISPDQELPMLPVLISRADIPHDKSIGSLMATDRIDPALVASRTVVVPFQPFIGVLGYAAGDNPLTYPAADYQAARRLIETAAEMVDYVIVDCKASLLNAFTAAGIEIGNVVIRILTADVRGSAYLQCNSQLLTDVRFHYDNQLTFIGKAQPFEALDIINHVVGRIDGFLPWNKEIVRKSLEGGIFDLSLATGKYAKAIRKVEEAITFEPNI